MGRLVRHSKGIWDDGGSLLCVRFFFVSFFAYSNFQPAFVIGHDHVTVTAHGNHSRYALFAGGLLLSRTMGQFKVAGRF
jgi:hypothetical protein